MSKISIPSDGIYNKISGSVSKCKSSLNNAQNSTSFQIPSGFQYTSFCYSLSSKISTYSKEINDISNKTIESEKKYNNLSERIASSVNATPASIIELHDRLILKK